jgi:hypothetical protein
MRILQLAIFVPFDENVYALAHIGRAHAAVHRCDG